MPVRHRLTRKNSAVFPWLRALAFALLVLSALNQLPFYPPILVPVLALAAAALSLFIPAVAVLVVVVIIALPLMAANLAAGGVFLLLGLAASQYLGQDNARAFLVVGLAFAASMYDAGWAVAIVAGYALGSSEGAIVALLACLSIEGVGLVTGRETLGLVATGGTAPGLLDFSAASPGTVVVDGVEYAALGFKWLAPAFSALEVDELTSAFRGVQHIALLIVQPVIWAIAAAITGATVRPVGTSKRTVTAFASVAVGVAAIAGASAAMMVATSGPETGSALGVGAIVSLVVCVVWVTLSEFAFPASRIEMQRGAPSLHAEDADVDELLRVISTAEDALAAKHTIEATVLITDMKSFSAMTEVEGSVLTAKAIQRHRDLLLPVIARNGGSGKSTGGDGLLAAFERPGDAVTASVEMQSVLQEANAAHSSERPTSIRIGMAHGEVVVDKHGRPFIGDALNRAARIMDLGDGGQILADSEVMNMTPAPPPVHDHGPHTVKNILGAMQVIEILWAPGQKPQTPRKSPGTPPAAEETPEAPAE